MNIIYIDRLTGEEQKEKVYKERALSFLYGGRWWNRVIRPLLLPFVARSSLFSTFYGRLQKRGASAAKIVPFIRRFEVDVSEFAEPVSSFRSFNDFFIRKLKPEARPITGDESVTVIPADGRFYFYQDVRHCPLLAIKGRRFDLHTLIGDAHLAQTYADGSLVLARLCPSDYHRFHFPCACIPGSTTLIPGHLYSVNPLALKVRLGILAENRRTRCLLHTEHFGQVLYMEIGATNVGSICQTYRPGVVQLKGAEKGYFEFGGSALVLLFAKDTIHFDADLVNATQRGLEMRCLLGQSMGRVTNSK